MKRKGTIKIHADPWFYTTIVSFRLRRGAMVYSFDASSPAFLRYSLMDLNIEIAVSNNNRKYKFY